MLYELYADSAAFAAHMEGASMAKAREQLGAMVISLAGIQCTPGVDLRA
jgi:quinol monooxygenase YgiN